MKRGECYIHETAMDCFIELVKHPVKLADDRWALTVMWWNKGQMGAPYCLNIKQSFKLNPEQRKGWRLYESAICRQQSI